MMRIQKQALVASLSILLALSASKCLADNVSVVYGEPEYTVSENGVKTVYFTPNLCSRDTAESLPASDKLILALNLTGEATVLSFQVATVGQADSQQQEQVVVRVGDVQPEDGPSENPLCSIATLNSSSLMTTFDCEQPLNGTFVTVTKNDGGSMDICGFSARLSDDSSADGPFLTADPIQVMGLENDNLGEPAVFAESPEIVFVETPPLVFAAEAPEIVFVQTPPLIFAAEPVAPPTDSDVIVFGGSSFVENGNVPKGPAASGLPLPSPAASPLQQANILLAQSAGPVPAPAPAPGPSALSPSGTVTVLSIINSISTDSAVTTLNLTNTPVPAPGPGPAMAPGSEGAAAVQPIISFAGSEEPSVPAPVPGPAPALAPAPVPAQAEALLPVVNFAGSQTQAAAPVPAPGPAPVPAPEVEPAVSFAANQQTLPTLVPAPAPGVVSGLAPGSSPAGLAVVPSPVPAPAPAPGTGAQQTVLVFASSSTAPTPAPVPAPAPAPSSEEQEITVVASEPVAAPPISFSRANLIGDQPQSPPAQSNTPSSSGSSQSSKGSSLSGGDKAGIAVGVIAGVALLAAATYFIIQRRR